MTFARSYIIKGRPQTQVSIVNLAEFIYGFSWAVMYILMGYRGVLNIYSLCISELSQRVVYLNW